MEVVERIEDARDCGGGCTPVETLRPPRVAGWSALCAIRPRPPPVSVVPVLCAAAVVAAERVVCTPLRGNELL